MRQPFEQQLVAGDAWNWRVIPEPPLASDATLKYFLRGRTAQKLDMPGTVGADGSVTFAATSADTLGLVGELTWSLCLFDASNNRTELARGTVTVIADIQSAGDSFDGRTWNKRMLDAITAVLEGRATRVEKLYQIAGRHIELIPASELLQLKGDLQSAYDRELVASGQKRSGGNQIKVGFGRRNGRMGEWH
jgi:hypothetical protein